MHRSTHGATVFDNHMLGAAKYERPTVFDMHAWQSKYAQSNRFYMRARLNEVCTEQLFLISHARCCEVSTGHTCLAHEVCTEQPFYRHARCSEVCTLQPFLYACSVQRSMHGATVFYMHAQCSEVCTEQPLLYACSVQRNMHRAPDFDMRARCSEVCTEQPVMTCLLGASKYARSNCFI